MLFWLTVGFIVLGIMFVAISRVSWYKIYKKDGLNPKLAKFAKFMYNNDDVFSSFGGLVSIIFSVVAAIMLLIIGCSYLDANAKVELYNERYEALEYKVTSGACRDEFGLLSKSVIDEVQDWNEDLIYYQTIQDDLWLGIFYPNIFDQFKTIEYSSYSTAQTNDEFIEGELS